MKHKILFGDEAVNTDRAIRLEVPESKTVSKGVPSPTSIERSNRMLDTLEDVDYSLRP